MKYQALLLLLLLSACGSDRNQMMTKLIIEQKSLKDSANHINDKIGYYLKKGGADSAGFQQKELGAVYGRLIAIQHSIDSLDKMK